MFNRNNRSETIYINRYVDTIRTYNSIERGIDNLVHVLERERERYTIYTYRLKCKYKEAKALLGSSSKLLEINKAYTSSKLKHIAKVEEINNSISLAITLLNRLQEQADRIVRLLLTDYPTFLLGLLFKSSSKDFLLTFKKLYKCNMIKKMLALCR